MCYGKRREPQYISGCATGTRGSSKLPMQSHSKTVYVYCHIVV